ncbi:MAG: hypothetical protein KF886_15350 [Candidatus Hydrogenedentes bacterium]|nr:hypothetical protein [Candidatus Hydrogenedentota bacterium]
MSDRNLTRAYHTPPGFAGSYRRILLGRRDRHRAGDPLPPLEARWNGASATPDRIARYADACGLPDTPNYPLLFPHILVSPMQIDLISQPAFPLSPMGAVHTRIHVLQHRPIPRDARVDVSCRLSASRVLKAGLEFDFTTVLTLDGAPCWESVSANLIRGKKFGDPADPPALAHLDELGDPEGEHAWTVPKDMGWRYARITGDFNPIHISRILARFLGFPRDIIHGMWSAARCLAHLPAPDPGSPIRADLLFKGPVFMESHVTMKHARRDAGHAFDLYCADNPRPVIRGQVRPAEPGERLSDTTEA